MKGIIFIAIIFLITGCGNSSVEIPKTPEQLKVELLGQERLTPLIYLSVEAKMRSDDKLIRSAGLFRNAEYASDGNTIYGTIKNTATMAKFKDIVLTVTFYSQTETIIESKDFVIYEYYKPNSTNNFELKVYPPEAMVKFGLEVKNATAVD